MAGRKKIVTAENIKEALRKLKRQPRHKRRRKLLSGSADSARYTYPSINITLIAKNIGVNSSYLRNKDNVDEDVLKLLEPFRVKSNKQNNDDEPTPGSKLWLKKRYDEVSEEKKELKTRIKLLRDGLIDCEEWKTIATKNEELLDDLRSQKENMENKDREKDLTISKLKSENMRLRSALLKEKGRKKDN